VLLVDDLQKHGLGPRSTRHAHEVLCRALKQAVRWRLLITNPAADITLPKRVSKEMKALTPDEAKKFLKSCESDEYGLVFELALISGMRPEE
jgi:integrase